MIEHPEAPKQSLGDVIDKLSILIRKVQFGETQAMKELEYLQIALTNMGYDGSLIVTIIEVAQANFEIWERENKLRNGGEDEFSLAEIGKRAIEIRDFNRKRVKAKNEINRITELGFREFKVKHRSQC